MVIIANWKMHKDRAAARDFCQLFLPLVRDLSAVEIVICPPFTALEAAGEGLRGSTVRLGAQNLFWEPQGAFTGEISAEMLAAAGCSHVLVGHSERRAIFGENDRAVNQKLLAARRAGLVPVLCVGETLAERQTGQAMEIVRTQLLGGLAGFEAAPPGLVVAYEPVWAIGTGVNARPEDAQQMAAEIKACLAELYGEENAGRVPVLYGGSVKPENIKDFVLQPDIEGALVGGASLDADQFARIVRLSAGAE